MKIFNNLKFQLFQQKKINYHDQSQTVYKYTENYNTTLKFLIFTA